MYTYNIILHLSYKFIIIINEKYNLFLFFEFVYILVNV